MKTKVKYPVGERIANLADALFMSAVFGLTSVKVWVGAFSLLALWWIATRYVDWRILVCGAAILPFPVLFIRHLAGSYFCGRCFLFSLRVEKGRCPSCRDKPAFARH